MKHVLRQAQIMPDEVAVALSLTPVRLARLLDGEEVPSRRLLEYFARACGADPTILLMVREDQQRRTTRT
ncbi:helix-turn-helix domain-containing protein [Streptomyces sp. NPDC059819]|uniref:helix-turn-helix domain-containing protein n=1 Tax=Streptomyces sp. NPDC059819 TaxID=3346963 RepID=UPI0036500004